MKAITSTFNSGSASNETFNVRPMAAGNGGQAEGLVMQLMNIASQVDELLRPWPAPFSYAYSRLVKALARAGHDVLELDRMRLRVAGLREPVSLMEALLQQVTGLQPLPRDPERIEAGLHLLDTPDLNPPKPLSGSELINVMDQAAAGFFQGYVNQLRAFFYTPAPPPRADTLIDRLCTLRLAMLRAELQLMQSGNRLSAADLAVLGAVLSQPVSARRRALAGFVPDVFAIALSINGAQAGLDIVNCLLFTECGGQQPATAGRAIFWSPGSGFESFASVGECTTQLQARLADKARRWELLSHVSTGTQPQVTAWLDSTANGKIGGLQFERVEHDFVRETQLRAIAKVLADAGFACRTAQAIPLSAQAFENLIHSELVQGRAGLVLEPVVEMARLQAFEAAIPQWLKNASKADKLAYAGLLQRYPGAGQEQQNYLHDIPPLAEYARALLKLRLELDFAGQAPDPDAIEVVIDTYVPSPVPVGSTPSFLPAATTRTVQTLTQFSLNGFYRLNAGAISLRAPNGSALPTALNATYVKRLTRQLEIGAHYRALLQDKLAPGKPGVTLRQQQFSEQLSLQVMEQALREKLIDPGQEMAYRYIQQVINMPDGAARLTLDRMPIIVRPFELVAEPEADPDRARGLYIIGPVESGAGPQILWVNYSERFTFKAYNNEAALLDDLRINTDLQALVLQRLEPEARKTYNYGGFVEPHIPQYVDASLGSFMLRPAPPTLAPRPIAGNLFEQLYVDNYHLLLDMAAAQSKTSAEADWESFKYLFSLIASTALMFLPARLSIPMVVWQTAGFVQQGFEAAQKGEWGEAVADFASSLAQIGSGYLTLRQLKTVTPTVLRQPQSEVAVHLTPEQEIGLQPFQANDVALLELKQDSLTRLYRHPGTGLHYVLLGGHVFQVQAWRERWRIFIGEGREGPLVKINERDHWELDLKEPLLGGGPVLSTTASISDRLTHEMQAIGMASIERRFPDKAQAIREAHAQAVTYLQRSQSALHTLLEPGTQNARNRALIQTFFDVEHVDQPLLDRLNETIGPLLARFLHPDLSPLTSSKYVVCRSRFNDKAVAWIHRWDLHKRLYLSEHFFSTLFETPNALSQAFVKATQPPFRTNVHYRAAFMLHEISHQALDTEDINYLNPGFPYEDLLDESTPLGSQIKSFNQIVQSCHSPYISTEHLFQQFDPEERTWADIPANPGKAKIKALSGVRTLEQARPIFKHDARKRIDLMLANADSVVLLITRLGRDHPQLPEVNTRE